MIATTPQLKALLTMPAALRPLVFDAFTATPIACRCKSGPIRTRLFSASSLQYRAAKFPNVAALLIPEFRTSPITEISPDELFKASSLSSAPGQPIEEELNKLYLRNPAAFVYAESNFYNLRRNSRVPEVCVLGRSNVGKSSFVNALASRTSNALARVSSKAGKTRSLNTYGFGPPLTVKELEARGAEFKDEDIPTHTFFLMDMPGYGHASLKEWGKNITLYLSKRKAVKGAIILIDAEVGLKDSDSHLLELLNAAQLRTAVVLTKADKTKKGLGGLHEVCKQVWDTIHAIEVKTTDGNWVWERDVYVTAVGARDHDVVKSTVTIARLAVAKLAGLIKDEKPDSGKNKGWAGKTISFDDLQYISSEGSTPSESATVIDSPKAAPPVSSPKKTAAPVKPKNVFADLEQAAAPQNSGRARSSVGGRTRSRIGGRSTHVRAFHSMPARKSEEAQAKPTTTELKAIIDSFIQGRPVDTPRDAVRRLRERREAHPPRIFKSTLTKSAQRQARRLRKRFPEQTMLALQVFKQRLQTEEYRRQLTAEQMARQRNFADEDWPAAADTRTRKTDDQVMDASEFDEAFATSEGLETRKSGAKSRESKESKGSKGGKTNKKKDKGRYEE